MLKSFLIFIVSTFVLATVSAFSLNPFWCKGVALNSSGQVLPNTSLTVIVTIENSGGVLYQETHNSVPTDQFAVFTVEVGSGGSVTGLLSGISVTADTRIKLQAGGVLSMVSGLTDVLTSYYNSGTSDWALEGNAGTTPGTDFIGTTDNQPLTFKVNNNWAGQISTGLNASYGLNALKSNTSGHANTGVGVMALQANTNGYNNSAFGVNTLYSNIQGHDNTANGVGALYSNVSGNSNAAFGTVAMNSNSSGSNNVAVGYLAGWDITNGSNNTAVGYNARVNYGVIGQNNTTAIGANAKGSESNQVVLGDENVTNLVCHGAYAGTTDQQPNLYVSSWGQIMRSTTAKTVRSIQDATTSASPITVTSTIVNVGTLSSAKVLESTDIGTIVYVIGNASGFNTLNSRTFNQGATFIFTGAQWLCVGVY